MIALNGSPDRNLDALIKAVAHLHNLTSQEQIDIAAVDEAIERLAAADAKIPALGEIYKPSPPVSKAMDMISTPNAALYYFSEVVKRLHAKSTATPLNLRVVKQLASDACYYWEHRPK